MGADANTGRCQGVETTAGMHRHEGYTATPAAGGIGYIGNAIKRNKIEAV